MNTTQTIAERYGVDESNGLMDGQAYHAGVTYEHEYSLAEVKAAGGRISRVRILAEVRGGIGWTCDISYIHATLADGTTVPVSTSKMPSSSIGLLLRNLKREFIEWGKAEGVYTKGLGLLDEGNWSILR